VIVAVSVMVGLVMALGGHQLLQRRVARRAFGGLAQLQDVLGSILGVQLETVDGPLFDPANAGAGGKVTLGGLLQVVDRGLDVPAPADMDAAAVLQPVDRLVALALEVALRLVDENEAPGVELDAGGGQRIVEFAYGGGRRQLCFEHAGPAVELEENDYCGHLLLLVSDVWFQQRESEVSGDLAEASAGDYPRHAK
jgi:hypothetical protein